MPLLGRAALRKPIGMAAFEEEFARKRPSITYTTKSTAAKIVTRQPIVLRVRDQTGEETLFKVKRATRLENVFYTFAHRKGVSVDSLRFLFEGDRVNPSATVASLELEDDDQIDVMLEQQGD